MHIDDDEEATRAPTLEQQQVVEVTCSLNH